MDPFEMLINDHREVEKLFAEFELLAEEWVDLPAIAEVGRQILQALTVHAELEERLVYPALKPKVESPLDVLAAVEEHHVAKHLIKELMAMTPEDERYEAKMLVLQELVVTHVEEEEQALFPEARLVLDSDQIAGLAIQLEEVRQRLGQQTTSLHVTMVREYPVEQPKET